MLVLQLCVSLRELDVTLGHILDLSRETVEIVKARGAFLALYIAGEFIINLALVGGQGCNELLLIGRPGHADAEFDRAVPETDISPLLLYRLPQRLLLLLADLFHLYAHSLQQKLQSLLVCTPLCLALF
jgi:hypothetical protein